MDNIQQQLEIALHDAVRQNNPTLADALDRVIQRGATMRDIKRIARAAQKTAPPANPGKTQITLYAVECYARIEIARR